MTVMRDRGTRGGGKGREEKRDRGKRGEKWREREGGDREIRGKGDTGVGI